MKKQGKGALRFAKLATAKTRSVNATHGVKHRETPAEYRWKPGQSGNPSGRPSAAHKALKDAVKAKLEAVEHRSGKCNVERLIDNAFRRALQGKDKITELLLAYYFGKPLQSQVNVNREFTAEDQLAGMTEEELNAKLLEKLKAHRASGVIQ